MIYVIIFLLNVADLVTTHIGVNIMGYEELNPLAALIIGSWLIVPLKLGGAFLVAYGLWWCRKKKAGRVAAWGILLLYILVVVNNSAALLI